MSDPTEMVPALICERWRVMLPEYRAARHHEHPFWEKPRIDSMRANLNPGDVLYDVGTEDGDLSAVFAAWVDGYGDYDEVEVRDGANRTVSVTRTPRGQRGGIVLIEPNAKVWPSIKATWEANALPEPLAMWPGFVSDKNRWSERPPLFSWPGSASGPIDTAHGFSDLRHHRDVPALTLDSLASSCGRAPTAITIDTEGSEYAVLLGATRILREDRPLVWVSIHPEMLAGYGQTPESLVALMATRGYAREHLAAEHEWHTLFYPEERYPVLPYTRGRR